jgi:hypothetical protein
MAFTKRPLVPQFRHRNFMLSTHADRPAWRLFLPATESIWAEVYTLSNAQLSLSGAAAAPYELRALIQNEQAEQVNASC